MNTKFHVPQNGKCNQLGFTHQSHLARLSTIEQKIYCILRYHLPLFLIWFYIDLTISLKKKIKIWDWQPNSMKQKMTYHCTFLRRLWQMRFGKILLLFPYYEGHAHKRMRLVDIFVGVVIIVVIASTTFFCRF